MKARLLALLLIAVLLLSACAPSNLGKTENTTPSTPQTQATAPSTQPTTPSATQPIIPTTPSVPEVINCTYTSSDSFSMFFGNVTRYFNQGGPNRIKITRTAPDGTKSDFTVSYQYDSKEFRYKEGTQVRNFSNIAYYTYIGSEADNFDILEYVLLCNESTASYLDTIDADEPAAIVIYAQRNTLDSQTESYGDVPEDLLGLKDMNGYYIRNAKFLENSMFYPEKNVIDQTVTLHRYDFSGSVISATKQDFYLDSLCELEDGGFLAYEFIEPNISALFRYNADGNLVWRYIFPAQESDNNLIKHIFVHNNEIYTFGVFDGYILTMKFSMDGLPHERKTFGGNEDADLHRVIPTYNGFQAVVLTRSRFGDFPISDANESREYVSADFDYDLNLINRSHIGAQIDNNYNVGIMDGKHYYTDDPLFTYHTADKLPVHENGQPMQVINAFSHDNGHVVIRLQKLSTESNIAYFDTTFRELIITGYDRSGTPLWQFTSPFSPAVHGVLE